VWGGGGGNRSSTWKSSLGKGGTLPVELYAIKILVLRPGRPTLVETIAMRCAKLNLRKICTEVSEEPVTKDSERIRRDIENAVRHGVTWEVIQLLGGKKIRSTLG